MKRSIFKFALFVLLGAIINVVVAWGAALYSGGRIDLRSRNVSYGNTLDLRHGVTVSYTSLCFTLESVRTEVHVPPQKDEGGLNYADFSGEWETPIRVLTGGPIRSMQCSLLEVFRDQSWGQRSRCGLPTPWRINSKLMIKRTLPLRPLWPGFAINTIFYAAIVWMLFAFPGVVRRRMRAHRGRCVACGYDLRGQECGTDHKLCPECGKPVMVSDVRPCGEG